MSLHALENVGTGGDGHEEHAHQTVSLQYENIEQQNESYIVGMWSFLVTEVMFFGALFLLYSLYRVLYFNAYLEAHQFLDVKWGTLNTGILLLSSWSMVMAVYSGQKGRRSAVLGFLTVTQLCALGFMGVKSVEYSKKLHEGLFPDARFNYAKALTMHHEEAARTGQVHAAVSPRHEMASKALEEAEKEGEVHFVPSPTGLVDTAAAPADGQIREALPSAAWSKFEREQNKARIFFSIYFTMTGLHGVHVIVGMLLMGALMYFYASKHHCVEDYIPLELIGLYWHFVDIVWIFLFPLMYLIS